MTTKHRRWPGPNAVAIIETTRETGGVVEKDKRFTITSLVMLAHLPGPIARSHRAIVNSLHCVMDLVIRDNECRMRTNHAPANCAAIRQMDCNSLRRLSGEASSRGRRKVPEWDDEFHASLVTV
jgi:predicted transposase YbfD/YdcC